jgi:hypothetical protein
MSLSRSIFWSRVEISERVGTCLGTGRKALDSGPGVRRWKCTTQLVLGFLYLWESASLLSYVSYFCFILTIDEGKNILILTPLVMALFMLSSAILTDVAKTAVGEPLIQSRNQFEEASRLLFFHCRLGIILYYSWCMNSRLVVGGCWMVRRWRVGGKKVGWSSET